MADLHVSWSQQTGKIIYDIPSVHRRCLYRKNESAHTYYDWDIKFGGVDYNTLI